MYNVWVRLNAVVFFGLTVIVGLSVLAAISMAGHSKRNLPSKLDCTMLTITIVNHNNLILINVILINVKKRWINWS